METCYMCNNPSTSREHVPPQSLFPKKKDLPEGLDFRKNLITVPSCDLHNSNKSTDDEYLMFILSSVLQGNEHQSRHFRTTIMRAIKRKSHVFTSFMKDVTPILLKDENGNVSSSAAYKVDAERIDHIFHHIACGIYYHCYKKKWLGGTTVINNFLMSFDAKNASKINQKLQDISSQMSKSFSNVISVGENDKIFKYKMLTDGKYRHALHLIFYDDIEFTILYNSYFY